MNYVDLGSLGILLFSIGMGFFRGLVWEILKYISLGLSILLTGFSVYKLSPFFGDTEGAFWWLFGLGIAIFVASSCVTLFIVHKISKLVGKSHFSFMDKILGSVFGALRACIFILFLYSGLMLVTMNQKPDWIQTSVLVGPLDKGSKIIQDILYRTTTDKMRKIFKLDKLHEVIQLVK